MHELSNDSKYVLSSLKVTKVRAQKVSECNIGWHVECEKIYFLGCNILSTLMDLNFECKKQNYKLKYPAQFLIKTPRIFNSYIVLTIY